MFGLLRPAALVVHEVGVELGQAHDLEPALLEDAVQHTRVVGPEEMERSVGLGRWTQPERPGDRPGIALEVAVHGWQPETQGDAKFDLENLSVTAGADVAFAHSSIRCGGSMPDSHAFEDLVRATFCLQKLEGSWKISHQHISKPLPQASG